MSFDDLLQKIGNFGTYQKRIFFFLCLPAISCALHKLSGVFLLAKPDHRCQLPDELPDATYSLPPDIMNSSYPYDSMTKKWSSCKMYTMNNNNTNSLSNSSQKCDHWIYDKSIFKNTAVMEFNLVCNKNFYKGYSDSLLMVGVMLGSIIFGYVSDKIGRKHVFTISVWLQGIAGIGLALAPEFWSFAFLRVFVGASTSGLYMAAYVIGLEFVGSNKRMFVGVVMQMFFSVGFIVESIFGYIFTDWRYFQFAITIPTFIFTSYVLFMPESVRWLLANDKKEEAVKLLKKIARVNGVDMSSSDVLNILNNDDEEEKAEIHEEEKQKATFFDLFRHPAIRNRSFLVMLLWFVNSSAYYGISWSTSSLGGNQFLVFSLMGLVEFPAYSFLLLTLNRWGRKINISGFMILAAMCLLTTLFVSKSNTWLMITCAMLAKLAITASYGAVYVYTAEQFPTVVRNRGLGVGSFFARIGGIMAPYINNTSDIWINMPLVIYGSLALLVGAWSLVLPETLNKELPDTIEDLIASSEKKYKPVKLEKETTFKENKLKNDNV
ncbi:organic cation transporter protein [Daktulosphaira vitifoliae]|uniref:organic cation transporter protein n=1 Tax=Daktulosphaira vitifoliae TaxID=58002 RepID=UPI0021A999AC|nr:organic cation transporter protein [Daktulosphaira vitifoliae]XP_050525746.1 organic cation transporter protein [Daktulosphaira vitifoliae]